MGVEAFLEKIKKHWLAVVLIIFLLFAVKSFLPGIDLAGIAASAPTEMAYQKAYSGAPSYELSDRYMPSYPVGGDDLAPEEPNRKIEKSASLDTEVERGQFDPAQDKLRKIVTSAQGFVLNQNTGRYGKDQSKRGTYSLRVPSNTYDGVLAQLQTLGEVQSFNENAADITGQYLNTEAQLAVEKQRLERYKKLYDEWGTLEEKLKLEDRVFNQELRIKQLEESLKGMNQRVDYSSIGVTLREKESEWAQIGFVAFGSLAKTFMDSLETLLYFISALLPWAVALLIIWLAVRWIRNRSNTKKR